MDGKSIRYALTAIKSVGRPVIEAVVGERNERGLYTNLKDFITRMADVALLDEHKQYFLQLLSEQFPELSELHSK